jgi:hypothetical protein
MKRRRPPSALEAFERALELAARAERLRVVCQVMGRSMSPTMYSRALELAVLAEDRARDAANAVRVALGGDPEPDPADPPRVRPDA